MGLPEKEVGVRQEVYLPAHRTLDYRGSVYVKHVSGPGELEVSLRSRKDSRNTLARRQLDLSGDGWKRYDFEFRIPDGEAVTLEPLDFVVSVKNETRVLIDQASLVPGDAIEGMDPEMIAMAKAIKSPIIRYGGNFTSAYHWRDGIGPPDKRISMLNVAWGMPEYNTFGTDEFLRFCELLGARPQIALNLGSGNPGEASQWVKYVNERWGDHSGGLLWELGNELWGSFQVGYPTRQRVGDRTQAFSGAVRTVDPRAKLIATGGDEDSYQEWNAAQLTNAGSFDYLSTHFVVTTDKVVRSNPSPDFISSSAFALPVGLERKLREMDRQIQSNPTARGKVKIAFTEWLFWASQDTAPRYDNMGGAICTAGFLNMLLRVADIVPVADMTGIIEFGGIWKKRGRVFGTPAYWAFRMYSKADATVPVEVSTRSAQYNVEQGSTRLPNIPDVPYLDTVALVNERRDKLTLFCVNRNLARDLPTAISIAGFAVDPQVAVQTLYASTIYAKNDEAHPDAVIPHRETARFDGETLHYTFRHESITVMEFRKKT